MADPSKVNDQNLLPVQAYFDTDGQFQTFIGQGQPFYATTNPDQSGLHITDSTINSTTIGATTPSTGVFTNVHATTGQVDTQPVANTDIANKQYVDSIAQGLSPKQAVKCATTANITLSGLQTIDTYTTLAGDRVLVKNQTASAENGIYIAAAGVWTRSTDMDVWSEVPGAYTVALNGSVNVDTGWVCTAADTGTIGVTAMPWVQFSAASTYFAGTGLTLASNTFSITNTGVTAGSYGSASSSAVFAVNAQGQLTSATATPIAIAASQITSGTIASGLISGSYTGITGVGTLTAGAWNASTIGVPYGGTGATSLTGYVKGNGTSAFSASATVPTTDLSGTISNAQLANSTISGVALGGNLYNLTFGSGITASNSTYNGSAAVTISNASPMTYPGAGIPNSTGSAWGTSYSTSGTGTVVPLATAATLNNPTISDYTAYTPTTAPAYAEGRVFYDSTAHTLNYYNDNSQMSLNIGQEQIVRVRNQTGSQINNGQVVYISGATGQTPLASLAQANSYTTSQVIGVATVDIPNNGFGYATVNGTVNDIDTSAFTDGQNVYLSATTPGAITSTEPVSPNYGVHVGVILYAHAVHGKLYVAPINKSIDTGYIIGQVAIAQGGTNGTATPTAGAVAYGTGSAYAFTSAGSAGQVLTSNGSSAPTWTAPTANITITDDTTTNATRYPLFSTATTGSISTEYTSSTKYQFNPSTGVLTATGFSGSGASLTSLTAGNLTGTIPSTVLGNSTVYIGTTAIALNRSSASQSLTGVSIDGSAGSATTATTATNANNVAITDDTSTNSTFYPTFVSNSTGNLGVDTSSTKLQYNPFTGTLAATVHKSLNSANNLQFTGANTGLEPVLSATGTDTNVALAIKTQGTGAIDLAAGSSGVNISNGGTVTAITRTNSGTNYTSAPTVAITAPTTAGGVQATATAVIAASATATISNGGTGYSLNDTLTIVGGTSTSASTWTVTGVTGGVVNAVTRVNAGAYTVAPTNPASTTGGTGSGCTLTLSWVVDTTFNITNAGSGYVEQPTVSFSGGGGSGAAAYATVGSNTVQKTIGNIHTFATPNSSVLALVDKNANGNYPTNTSVAFAMIPQQSAFGASYLGFGSAAYLGTTSTVSSAFQFATSVSSPVSNGSGGSTQFQIAHTASAVNYVQVTGAATGAAPVLSSQGSNAVIDFVITPKSTGKVVLTNGLQAGTF